MKKLSALFIFILAFAGAQNQKFTYEYRFVPDSTNRADVHKEFMILDVDPKGSRFYSYQKFTADSLMKVDLQKQIIAKSQAINITQSYKGRIFYSVSKNYPALKTFLHTRIGTDKYIILDERPIIWKILPEKQRKGEWDTQRAETEMFGRKWTAWFASDIPIQDGPYKFSGLPGLIVALEDTTKSHSYELKAIKRNSAAMSQEGNLQEDIKAIEIDYPRYKKLYHEQLKDPTKALRMMLSQSSGSIKMLDQSGAELSQAEMIRKREESAKESRKKNNNPIEIDIAI